MIHCSSWLHVLEHGNNRSQLIDGTDTLADSLFRTWMKQLVDRYYIGPHHVSVALTLYSSGTSLEIPLTSTKDKGKYYTVST